MENTEFEGCWLCGQPDLLVQHLNSVAQYSGEFERMPRFIRICEVTDKQIAAISVYDYADIDMITQYEINEEASLVGVHEEFEVQIVEELLAEGLLVKCENEPHFVKAW